MTSWIFAIRKGNEEHLDIAPKQEFWDTKYNTNVSKGHAVYFRQAGGASFVAPCVAAGSRRELGPGDTSPWNDIETYRWRCPLRLVSDQPTRNVTWTEVRKAVGRDISIQSGWCAIAEPSEEAVLARFFPGDGAGRSYRDDERRAELEMLGWDLRTFDLRAIARRQGHWLPQ